MSQRARKTSELLKKEEEIRRLLQELSARFALRPEEMEVLRTYQELETALEKLNLSELEDINRLLRDFIHDIERGLASLEDEDKARNYCDTISHKIERLKSRIYFQDIKIGERDAKSLLIEAERLIGEYRRSADIRAFVAGTIVGALLATILFRTRDCWLPRIVQMLERLLKLLNKFLSIA